MEITSESTQTLVLLSFRSECSASLALHGKICSYFAVGGTEGTQDQNKTKQYISLSQVLNTF